MREQIINNIEQKSTKKRKQTVNLQSRQKRVSKLFGEE